MYVHLFSYLRSGTPRTELATLLRDTFDDEERVMGTPVIRYVFIFTYVFVYK